MKISLSYTSYLSRVQQNITYVLWPVLLALLLGAVWVLYQSYGIIKAARHITPTPETKLVRINFGLYDKITQRQNSVAAFVPTPVLSPSPFGQETTQQDE